MERAEGERRAGPGGGVGEDEDVVAYSRIHLRKPLQRCQAAAIRAHRAPDTGHAQPVVQQAVGLVVLVFLADVTHCAMCAWHSSSRLG